MALFLRLARQGSLPAMATFLYQYQWSACEAPQFERSKNQIERPEDKKLMTPSEDFNLQEWLERHKISAKVYDADKLVTVFLEEMEKGLTGKSSSLAMIPSYVSMHEDIQVPINKNVAVVDAGGTNLRITLATSNENGNITPPKGSDMKTLKDVEKITIPGKNTLATGEQFYNILVEKLKPEANDFDVIGFCFSYPARISKDEEGNIDGTLIKWTKDINITDMEGTKVGAGLLEALENAKIYDKKVVLLNDTVAALLAGVAKMKDASAYVGFILGTGTNTAYVEKNENISTIEDNAGSQVINVESGGFTEFERADFDKQLDKESGNIFEKAISGGYLGPLALLLMKGLASEEGVFSKPGAQKVLSMKELETAHISNMCKGETDKDKIEDLVSESFTDADRKVMKQVFEAVVDRAALLAAVNITAVVLKSGASKEDTKPVCITIDGTTYYRTHQLQDKTEKYLRDLLGTKHQIQYQCIEVDPAPIIGAAIAGLTADSQPGVEQASF